MSHGEVDEKGKGKEKSEKPEKKDTVEWQLCDPMEVKDSPLRVNLYGKERTVEKKSNTAEASDNVDDRYGLLSDITEIKSEQYNEYFPFERE